MQGISRADRDLWDAGEVTGHLVAPGSVFAFLAEHRRELFPDSFTADLFPSRTGRPSLPADLVGSVLVLKELFDLSDTQTADALKFDLRWKVAARVSPLPPQVELQRIRGLGIGQVKQFLEHQHRPHQHHQQQQGQPPRREQVSGETVREQLAVLSQERERAARRHRAR